MLLLLAAAGAVLAGMLLIRGGGSGMTAQLLPEPTATPVADAFDQTVQTREVTLEAVSWYTIQTGIYSTAAAAEERVNAYADRGAPGYICRDGEKWRVFIACYGDKADAAAVRERLSGERGVETYLHTWTCPKITLRLSGMAGQLDVAEAGLTLMDHTAAVLRDTAALLDAGETTLAEARETVGALDGQIDLWRDTAQKRFRKPYPTLVEALFARALAWEESCGTFAAAADATALSAAMKLHAMAIFDGGCSLRRNLME